MKILRIILSQKKAHYRREETITNRMTYPLPPFSTVIGAIHKACNFINYHEMDISIQGNYDTMIRQAFTDYTFLNSFMKDRGILVKVANKNLISSNFIKVAETLKPQGNDILKEETIKVYDRKLLNEFKYLKENDPKSEELEKYKSLVTSLKFYEVLLNVNLIIHIKSNDETIDTIKENIYNLKSIGRSEDFVDLVECTEVTLKNIEEVTSNYSSYIDYNLVKSKDIFLKKIEKNAISGTLYYINKDYSVEKNKRIFNKKKVIYTSGYSVDEESTGVSYDGTYIISFN